MGEQNMVEKIGATAGVIWNYLDNNGQITMAALQKGTKLNKASLDMGIGWLAREGKIQIEGKRTKRISLVQE